MTPEDPDMLTFNDQQSDPTTPLISLDFAVNTIFHSGDHLTGLYTPGQYVIEVRAFADNDFETGEFQDLTINVLDPCLEATLTIDNLVFKD